MKSLLHKKGRFTYCLAAHMQLALVRHNFTMQITTLISGPVRNCGPDVSTRCKKTTMTHTSCTAIHAYLKYIYKAAQRIKIANKFHTTSQYNTH